MAGTYIFLPPSGGTTHWQAPVSTAASLPVTGDLTGTARLVQDTNVIYSFDGATWTPVGALLAPGAASDTNSIDMTITAGVLSAALRISPNAADANYLLVTNNIESTGTVGLRSEISYSSIRGIFSGTAPVSYNSSTGAFSMAAASTSVDGYLTSADWNTFNSKTTGAASSTDNAIARFDGTTGKVLQNSAAFVDDSGNLGLGTASPTSIIHTIASGAKTTAYSGNYFSNTATSGTSSIRKCGVEIQSTGTWNGASATNVGIYVSAVTGGTTNYDAIFNGGGNVGIGTTTPMSKLHLAGVSVGIRIEGTATDQRSWELDTIAGSAIGSSGGIFELIDRNSSTRRLLVGNDHGFQFNNAAGSSIVRILDSGNVGIGTTSPGAQLHVASTATTKIGTIVRAIAAQTANLQEWQNSSGTVLSSVSPAGLFKVGASGAITASTTLEVAGTTGAFLLPRLTSTQRDALTPTAGMCIYNSTTNVPQCYIGGSTNAWTDMMGWGS